MSDEKILGGQRGLANQPGGVRKGVYASYPAGTPKFHTGNTDESVARQARMYIEFPDQETFVLYRQNVPERARPFLEVLSPQSSSRGVGYFDFLLSQVNERYDEKVQVVETLSDSHVAYFFGQKALMWNLSGFLLNTQQDPWYDAFHILYSDVLRGTRTAQNQVPLRIRYDNREIIGSLTSMTTSLNAANETAINFNMQFLVSRVILHRYGNTPPTTLANPDDSSDTSDRDHEEWYSKMYISIQDAKTAEAQEDIRQRVEDFREGFDSGEVLRRVVLEGEGVVRVLSRLGINVLSQSVDFAGDWFNERFTEDEDLEPLDEPWMTPVGDEPLMTPVEDEPLMTPVEEE